MANRKHLKILKQGVEVWNQWRAKDYSVEPDLNGADLSYAQLPGANLDHADLAGANLHGANLRRANLNVTNLSSTDLSEADLSGAGLGGAELYETNLYKANLFEVEMALVSISYVDLSEVKNLDSVKHYAPSSVSIDTIYKSHGKISEKFLRGCGVPENFITDMSSLTGKSIEFYSCFISHSSKDEDFIKRLYTDLQGAGVRSWYAAEDLKIGDKFRDLIDESVRLHDKLLLVLSENSVSSPWVEKEVETALEKERDQGKIVLFPVRVDDSVLNIKTGWAADVRRSRHIGDFRDWKNHDSYKKAFERLIRDLTSETARNP